MGLRLLARLVSNPIGIWSEQHFSEPIVVNRTAFGSRVVVSDPAAIRHVLVGNESNYIRDDLQRRIMLRTTGHSLFSASGAEWHWQRRTLAPLFSPASLAHYVPAMAEAAAAAVARLAQAADGPPIEIYAEMSRAAVDAVARTILPDAIEEDLADVAASIRRFADGAGSISLFDLIGMPDWLPGLRRLRALGAARAVARRSRAILARRRVAGGADARTTADLVAVLCAARHPQTGTPMADRTIEDNVSTFLGAGSDTVASALTWSLYLLSQSPDVCDAVTREVDAVVGERPMTADLVQGLALTRAVIEEAMRLYPPAPILSRAALRDDVLCGQKISAGSVVIIAPWVVHRHRRLWDDPLAFDPGRFLPDRRERIVRYAYLPFGAGPRICIGMNFALQEAIIVLAHLLRAMRFELAPDADVRVFQCVTLRPRDGLPMIVTRRATSRSSVPSSR